MYTAMVWPMALESLGSAAVVVTGTTYPGWTVHELGVSCSSWR